MQTTGKFHTITDGELFVPDFFQPTSRRFSIIVHFQCGGASIQKQFYSTRINAVHYSSSLGGRSNQFKKPFSEDNNLFQDIIDEIQEKVRETTQQTELIAGDITITSFSAGYASVREILKEHKYYAQIQMIVMVDSIYASYVTPYIYVPVIEEMVDFMRFAQDAAQGKKVMVLTHIDHYIKDYCSSRIAADMILYAVGGNRKSTNEKTSLGIPISSRFDCQGFHLFHFARDTNSTHYDQFLLIEELLKTFYPKRE